MKSVGYYAEIVYSSNDDESGNYTCVVYDHAVIINNLLEDLKDRHQLTDREYVILQYMFEGMSNADIGRKLYISLSTVKKYAATIYQKLGIEGRHQLFQTIM